MFLPVTESLRRLGHLDMRYFTSLYLPNHHSYSFISLPMGTPSARMGLPSGVTPGLYQVGGSVLRVSAQGAQQESLAFGSVFHHGRTLLPNM